MRDFLCELYAFIVSICGKKRVEFIFNSYIMRYFTCICKKCKMECYIIRKNASQMLSLTASEFEALLPSFKYHWDEYYAHYTHPQRKIAKTAFHTIAQQENFRWLATNCFSYCPIWKTIHQNTWQIAGEELLAYGTFAGRMQRRPAWRYGTSYTATDGRRKTKILLQW